MLTLLTPTRDRSKAFGLVERYIERQTYKGPLQWIVINDGAEPYRYNMGQTVIIRDKSKDIPGTHSICYNYLAGLELVQGNRVFCIEDDDYYSPDYLQTLSDALDSFPLVGLAPAWYYNVLARKWRTMRNDSHCSLAATAFTSEVIPTFKLAWGIKGMIYADLFLWKHWGGTLEKPCQIIKNIEKKPLHVGIKALPWGCRGVGLGHDPIPGIRDGRFIKLKEWLGAEAGNYYEERRQEKGRSSQMGKK